MTTNTLPKSEKIVAISMNPEMATLDDVAQLAADWVEMVNALETIVYLGFCITPRTMMLFIERIKTGQDS